MPLPSPKLTLRRDACDRICTRLLGDLEEGIRAASGRNERLFEYDDQLRGNPFWGGLRPRWRNASDIVDPITREHHLETVARVVSIQRKDDWWIVNPISPKDAESSGKFETWLNDKVSQYDLATKHLYDLAYNCGRHSYAFLYCGWKQDYTTAWKTVYRDRQTRRIVEEEFLEPGRSYEEVEEPYEELIEEGLDLRVPHATDVVMWPPTCQDPQAAQWIADRREYTASQLVDMIEDCGLDEGVVYDLIGGGTRSGQREGDSYQARRDADEDLADPGEVFTCWVVVGRPPLILENGKPILKQADRRRDYVWITCPGRNAVLKFAPSPYRKRPWVLVQFLSEPGRLEGDSACSLTMGLQREATLAMRARGDLRDLTMQPTLMVPEESYDTFTRFSIYAGAVIPVSKTAGGPSAVVPLVQDKSGFEAAIADGQDFRQRAGHLFSAQAAEILPGTSAGEAPSATAVQLAAGGADDKFDLILTCMHRGIKDLAMVMVSHYRQFLPPEGEEVVVSGNVLQMTPDMLSKRFRISANGSSEMANTAIQMQRLEALYGVLMENPLLVQKMQQGDMTGAYALTSLLLRRSGAVRDVQTIIGQEPSPPPNAEMILQQFQQAVLAFAQQGDPGAVELLSMLQQMMASQPQPGGPAETALGPAGGMSSNPYADDSFLFGAEDGSYGSYSPYGSEGADGYYGFGSGLMSGAAAQTAGAGGM